jgi:two-component system nitrogen regulation response regulator GlnG
MSRILLVESVASDAESFKELVSGGEFEVVWCDSGSAAERLITPTTQGQFAAAFVRWEMLEPQLGFHLLLLCRKAWPEVPVVIVSATLDAGMVTRAYALGARDFLQKPLDPERVRSCLKSLLAVQSPPSPLVAEMRQSILGNSASMQETFRQVARVIPRDDLSVLIIGEAGTGKELFARAIHNLGARAKKSWVAVNVGAIPETLMESMLFGYEKGAFTGASERRAGFLEQAGDGTLFLDEIGELSLPLQVKLLRVLQERNFWRLGGSAPQDFTARVLFATNRDLARLVNEGMFRRDLYDRITEVQIHVPPLRERVEDVNLLAEHFLEIYAQGRRLRMARETLSVLRSYPFKGNVRELQNLVKGAVVACEGDDETILPPHLPLGRMGAFLDGGPPPLTVETPDPAMPDGALVPELLDELRQSLPSNWLDLPYREAVQPYERAFDRVYLSHLLQRHRHNVTRAASEAGIDAKTFRKRWKECGLPPLGAGEEVDA